MNDLIMILRDTRKHLMTGVSYMIPFVVAGGILLAASVMLYGKGAVPDSGALKDLFDIGVAGFTLMVPILAAYIGFSIADRSALAPAAIAGWVGTKFGAGFFGGIIAGLLAGIVVHYLKKVKVPVVMRSVMPIFVIPIIGTLICAGAMMWVFASPIGAATASMTQWLRGMQQGSIVALAIVMGLMIAFDMGGPVNKTAFFFGVAMIREGNPTVMGACAAAICIPHLGLGLATLLAPGKWTKRERESGLAALAMGVIGITEGAIPFAARDPFRVIPSLMVGSAVAGVISMVVGCELHVPHGGVFVLMIPNAVSHLVGYLVALVAGTVVTAVLLRIVKPSLQAA